MKKLLAFVTLTVLVVVGLAADQDSPFYCKTAFIGHIVSHDKGYKVTYYTNKGDPKVVYIPMEWFFATSGYKTDDGFLKAESFRGRGPQYPYIQFFWKNGKFHHLRLFVVDDYNDSTWDTINLAEHLETKFDPAKDLELTF